MKTKVPNVFSIGCLGAIRPLKNNLIQAVAAIEYGNENDIAIEFHVNSDRLEQSGENVYKNLVNLFASNPDHKLIGHPWLSHKEFVDLVKQMDLGLQVSLSETFNIVAADFVANDVPLIGSKDITWLPSMFQADPNSSQDILSKMNFIVDTRDFGLYKLNKVYLGWYNKKSQSVWKNYLKFDVN